MISTPQPHSWLDINTLESRFFKPPVENNKVESNYPEVRDTEGLRNWDSAVVSLCDCTLFGYNKETLVKDLRLRNKLTALEMTSKCSK